MSGEKKDPAEWTRAHQIASELAAPFPAKDLGWVPIFTAKDKSKAKCARFVDARAVQDRLDAVVGVNGWTDHYEFLVDGSVLCTLTLRIDGEWIAKQDIGTPADGSDVDTKRKGAVSGALKRAAVKFGIGRYLYHVPQKWFPMDKWGKVVFQGGTDDEEPQQARPQQQPAQQPQARQQQKPQQQPAQQPAQQPQQRTDEERAASVFARLRKIEERMVGEGLCKQGLFMTLIQDAAQKRHSQPRDPLSWRGDLEWVKEEIDRIEKGFLLVRDHKGSAVPVATGS